MVVKILKKIDELFLNGFLKNKYYKMKYANEVKKKLHYLNLKLQQPEKKALLLSDLIRKCPDNGDIVECGVGVGFSLTILSLLSKKKIYAFDSFEGFPTVFSEKEDKNLIKIFSKSKWNYKLMTIELVKKNLLRNGISENDFIKRIFLKKGFFPDSFKGFNQPISFLHLDVDLYLSYKECLNFFYPMLVKGAIVTFDEYSLDNEKKKKKGYNFIGAKIAIDEFIKEQNITLQKHFTGYRYFTKN